jgi:hypothetical protein
MADETEQNDSNLANEVDAQLRGVTRTNLPKNPKRVIRTFATDFAALSGGTQPEMSEKVEMAPARPVVKPVAPKPEPARAAPASAWPAAAPAPKPAPAPREPIPLSRPAGYPPVKSDPNEGRVVSETLVAPESRKTPSFFSQLFSALFGGGGAKQAPARAPEPPAVWTPPVRATVPEAPPEPAPRMQAQEESPAEREAVLMRLRTRAAAAPPLPPPVYPSPKPEPIPRPAPRPLPPQAPPTTAEPERLHTYAGDFNNRVNTANASAFSVFAAQADAAPQTTTVITTTKRTSGLTYVLITATLFVGGSLILFFAYRYFAGHQPVPIAMNNAPATLIVPDDTTTVSGAGSALMSALADTASAPVTIGNVRAIYLAVGTTTESGGALLAALKLPAPDILLRNLKADSTVGVVHAGDETRVFMVLDADSYERAFAGMLAWEPTMAGDLAVLYPPYPDAVIDTGTTTASSTVPAAPTPTYIPGFIDEVVSSHDVRAYRDSTGRTLFLYGFADQNTLIIARDEQAFTLLLARLSASRN